MKNIVFFIFSISFFLSFFSSAQNQNNQWRFGNSGGIDFNTNSPINVSGSSIATYEGSASVADRNTGALLFYTDGVTVWDATNQPMPNGNGLLGGTTQLLSSTTAAVIVPKPGSTKLYYIITIDEQSSSNGVRYSLVDMNLNSGLGDIVANQKNIQLFQTTSEKLEVVPASDGNSYWLLTHDEPGNNFYAFKISTLGIQSSPVISSVGSTQANGAGHMKVNRQFNKIAIGVTFGSKMELFDFDNSTGVVSNPISWNHGLQNPLIYGIEFSPNGKVLYVSNLDKLVQFDISLSSTNAIQNSAFLFPYSLSTGFSQPASLQLGPDDKIYINSGTIDVINCPNKLGSACGFQQYAIANQSGGGGYGLPKWVYYPNDTANVVNNFIVYLDSCFGNSTQFYIKNTAGISNVVWDFGDPVTGTNNTAVGFTANHSFSQTGSYNVRAIIANACGTDTLFLVGVSIINCNEPTNSISGIKLDGDTCSTSNSIAFQVVGTSSSSYFFWNFGDPASGTNDTITITGLSPFPFPSHTFTSPGVYNICVNYQEPGQSVQTICRKVAIGLCCTGLIVANDSCVENEVNFSIISNEIISNVNWNFGDASSGINNTSILNSPNHLFSSIGTYIVSAIVNYSCGIDTLKKIITISKCDNTSENCFLYLPNAFTPNGDGKNDLYFPSTPCSTEQFEFIIFNKWGEEIFKTTNQSDKWDGKYKDSDCTIGDYAYLISYKFPSQNSKIIYGFFTLLR